MMEIDSVWIGIGVFVLLAFLVRHPINPKLLAAGMLFVIIGLAARAMGVM